MTCKGHEGWFDVELVNMPYWEEKRALVDCDVNNLRVTRNGIEHNRSGQGGPIYQIIERVLLKQFKPIDPDRRFRNNAMVAKGWHMLDPA